MTIKNQHISFEEKCYKTLVIAKITLEINYSRNKSGISQSL